MQRPVLPAYAELHCRSNFSFLTGASHPSELVARAHQLGYAALAITDECSLAGVVRAHVEAQALGLHLVIGAEMRLTLSSLPPIDLGQYTAASGDAGETGVIGKVGEVGEVGKVGPGKANVRPATTSQGLVRERDAAEPLGQRLVLLAQTRRGYGNLSHWITLSRRRAEKGAYVAYASDVEGRAPSAPFLAGLPECLALLVPHAAQSFEVVLAQALWLKTWFGERAFMALELLHRAGDDELIEIVRRVSHLTDVPIVASGDVLMHVRSRKALQDTLTATRLNIPIAQCGSLLQPNAEQHLRSRLRLSTLYEPEWLARSVELAAQCRFALTSLKYEYPQELVPEGETPTSHLRTLTWIGFEARFRHARYSDEQRQRYAKTIEHELALIRQLEYEPYFLTVADIVRWARAKGILCQGRGSAANSVVCFCLEVTSVDPADASLLFERFISAERNEPPDIDIDFEHQRREEVIQYIYGKYGRHRAALTAVVITYRPRSAVRDVGRALGLDLQRIDGVAKGQQWFDGRQVSPERLRENGFDPESPLIRLWGELTHQLINFPRHLSQHPGGFVIAREQIELMVPVENAAMPNRSVIQWSKDDIEELRLIKVDILALGMLSALRRSLAYIAFKQGRPFELADVIKGDSATYDMICESDTVGVFQIESRAQMSMLPRLKPRVYYDLVVEVAIVRPGPIQGGMVHPYLRNRGLPPEEIVYPSEGIRLALERTLGVPIFQEQVMQIAINAADFTPGEADGLRRAMAAWKRKGGLGPYRERLVGRMVAKGYDPEFAESIFKQVQGFGEYGFPESHAAGFAHLAYASSWIKRHHPDAFLASLLNSQPMGFYAPAQLVRDAREHGVTVWPVDVRSSEWECTLVDVDSPYALTREIVDPPYALTREDVDPPLRAYARPPGGHHHRTGRAR